MKIVYVDVILLLQGRSKEIRYIAVNGRYLLNWILVILIWNEQYADWTENNSWKVFHNLCESHDLSFLLFFKMHNVGNNESVGNDDASAFEQLIRWIWHRGSHSLCILNYLGFRKHFKIIEFSHTLYCLLLHYTSSLWKEILIKTF